MGRRSYGRGIHWVTYTGLATRLASTFLKLVLSAALLLHLLDCVQRTLVCAETGL